MKKLGKPEFKLAKEFKAFITKGNVVDLAVGMIIGAAFTAIVTALVNSIFKPLINAIPMQGVEGLITMLVPKDANGIAQGAAGFSGTVDLTKSVYIDWGAFIMAIVNFLLTAVVLFGIIKLINKLRDGFGDVKGSAAFFKSLSKEELAELKKNGLTRKEIKALQLKRAEDAAAAAAAEEAAKAAEPAPETTDDILKDIRALLIAQREAAGQNKAEENGEESK